MDERNFRFHDGEKGAALTVKVIPQGGEIGITNIRKDGTLMVHVPQSFVDDNQRLIAYFSKLLKVKKNKITIVAGQDRNEKLVSIVDIEPSHVQEKILSILDMPGA